MITNAVVMQTLLFIWMIRSVLPDGTSQNPESKSQNPENSGIYFFEIQKKIQKDFR
jgi:hypothetical protein